jgi:hypothetical protein
MLEVKRHRTSILVYSARRTDLLMRVLYSTSGIRPWPRGRAVGWLLIGTTMMACDRTAPTQGSARPNLAPPVKAVAVNDAGMGPLSAIALQVVAGLQNPHVRAALNSALRDTSALGYGLDLQSCDESGVARDLFAAGERRGAAPAEVLCESVKRMPGVVLHMDQHQLALWSPNTIPLVTALAHPEAMLPRHLTAYRSPTVTLDVLADTHLSGPILVVLPLTHPSRRKGRRSALPASEMIRVDSARTAHRHVVAPGSR